MVHSHIQKIKSIISMILWFVGSLYREKQTAFVQPVKEGGFLF